MLNILAEIHNAYVLREKDTTYNVKTRSPVWSFFPPLFRGPDSFAIAEARECQGSAPSRPEASEKLDAATRQ